MNGEQVGISQEGDWYGLSKGTGQALDCGHGIRLADNMIRTLGIIKYKYTLLLLNQSTRFFCMLSLCTRSISHLAIPVHRYKNYT
jgi:hypothetical protein